MDRYDRIGNQGVAAIIPLLEKISYDGRVMPIEGSSLEKDLQGSGVDLVLWQSERRLLTIEIKTSKASDKDLFIEGITDIKIPRKGWLHRLRIDLFVHVSLATNRARLLRWGSFKTWFEDNFETYRSKAVFQVDTKKTAVGYWVPWRDIAYGLGQGDFGTYDLNDPNMWNPKLITMGLN